MFACLGRVLPTRHMLWQVQSLLSRRTVDDILTGQACYKKSLSLYLCINNKLNSKENLYTLVKNPKKPLPFRARHADVINIYPNMTVRQLAEAMGKDTDHVFEAFLYIPGTNRLDRDNSVITNIQTIKDVVKKSGFKYVMSSKAVKQIAHNKDARARPPAGPGSMVRRPPVVTIMGHVDHGKTTLLDQLRQSNMVDQEFGGITQHIGAFSVKLPTGEIITFLDTPGHAAFSAIRARGANVTDIIVLVVAAEDGVMNQTVESIELAKQAHVPIIVAINKIDKLDADIEGTKRGLMNYGIILEEFGGDVQMIPISALKGTNLLLLQETIIALAELLELKSEPNGLVEGTVIESKTDPQRGKLSTALIQRGTLKKGMHLVAGTASAKVRAMFDEAGCPVQAAPPGSPVEILGWKELPPAGKQILQIENTKRLKEVISWRKDQETLDKMDKDSIEIQRKNALHEIEYKAKLQLRLSEGRNRYRRTRTATLVDSHDGPQLHLVLKGDVNGSLEAILDTLDTYQSGSCQMNVIHHGTGKVTENDVELAESCNGIIVGFNVPVTDAVQQFAQERGVSLKSFNVIYHLIDDIKNELEARLPPKEVEEILGEANVLQVFRIKEKKKRVPVAGCRCTAGVLRRNKSFKLVRGEDVYYNGKLNSMRNMKTEVDTIKMDVECGLYFADKTLDIEQGDRVVCYETRLERDTIDWDVGF